MFRAVQVVGSGVRGFVRELCLDTGCLLTVSTGETYRTFSARSHSDYIVDDQMNGYTWCGVLPFNRHIFQQTIN